MSAAGSAVARATAGLLLAAAVVGCGGDSRESESGADAFSAVERRTVKIRVGRRAAPRWETLTVMRGPRPTSRTVRVAGRALQWRVRWTCGGRELSIAANGKPLVAGACRRRGRRTAITRGPVDLRVRGAGEWRVVVEQEVDSALREPPLPAMRMHGARRLASGSFYPLERRGRGRARLYRLAGGRLALRLERFNTAANTDLFVWVSTARRPRSSRQALAAPHVQLRALKSTLGDQNYLLPRGFDAARARSVVIWCEPVQIAYTAAPLER